MSRKTYSMRLSTEAHFLLEKIRFNCRYDSLADALDALLKSPQAAEFEFRRKKTHEGKMENVDHRLQ